MKNFFKDIKTLLIIALVIIILILSQCNGKSTPIEETVVTKIETRWDTITKIVPEYVPKWYKKIERDTIIDTVYIDTTRVLEDYFASYTYLDTLQNDSVTIIINDTVSQNKIKNRSIKYDILYPTTIITKETYLNKRKFYAGIGFGGTTKELSYIGGEFLFTSKKKYALGLGIGVNSKFDPAFMGKMYWKLGK